MVLINAFLAVLLGIGFLVMPGRMLSQLGGDEYVTPRLISQLFGTAMLGLGLLLWFVQDVTERKEIPKKGWKLPCLSAWANYYDPGNHSRASCARTGGLQW